MTILDEGRVIGIVRYREPADLDAILDEIVAAGIALVEVTLDTPGALAAIGRAGRAGATVGAGTVLSADEVRRAADAGARFVVSPGLTPAVVEAALDVGVEPIPGVLSPTELQQAIALGASNVKIFPAGPAGGPSLIAALRGPFPDVGMVPTGGIGVGDVAAYLDAGATAVGLGGSLTGRRPPRDAGELAALRERAEAAAKAAAR